VNLRASDGDLDLALIGNSSFSALIDGDARVVWACLPRFDSDPVFDRLLKGASSPIDGDYVVELADAVRSEQEYVTNTAVLRTTLFDSRGGAVEIVDFAPRYKQYGRTFRPLTLVRMLRPISGSPRVRVQLRPTSSVAGVSPAVTFGSNHVRYVLPHVVLRLTTDASVTAVLDGSYFLLERPLTLILGPDETPTRGVAETAREYFEETVSYWHEWVRFLGIPFEWQEAVIRAAITLKLNAYEDTGAIVAAMTTSIPEAPGTVRNWDYRYCWLRDAQFVVGALNRLGVTKTMESYLSFIVNVAAGSESGKLQPVYGINGRARLEERIVEGLPGYRGMGPVRFGNQAYEQVQNDVYGAAVLAATHVFFDRRLAMPGDEALFRRLERLGELAVGAFLEPDAGPWELRGERRIHNLLGGHVLGGLRSAGANRDPSRSRRTGSALEGPRRSHARDHPCEGFPPGARKLRRELRWRRRRRGASPLARARVSVGAGSSLRRYGERRGKAAPPGRLPLPLRHRRRLRLSRDGVPHL
jgi:GH15 family glucan-1,4-alpha-glucosidase